MDSSNKRSWSQYFMDQVYFWLSAEFYAVGLSAFLGVYVRVSLTNAFDGSGSEGDGVENCASKYGPFMEMFFAQTYLIPNFLGCFIMSYCIVNMKSITDVSVPMYKALSTGLCGCITTFSSWMTYAVDGTFAYYSWYQILIMIGLEFWLTWGAFSLGFSVAKLGIDLRYRIYQMAFEVAVDVEEIDEPEKLDGEGTTDQAKLMANVKDTIIEQVKNPAHQLQALNETEDDDEESLKPRPSSVPERPSMIEANYKVRSLSFDRVIATPPVSSEPKVQMPRLTQKFTRQVVKVDASNWGAASSSVARDPSASIDKGDRRTASVRSNTASYTLLHPLAAKISLWREDGEELGSLLGTSDTSGYSTAGGPNVRALNRLGGRALSVFPAIPIRSSGNISRQSDQPATSSRDSFVELSSSMQQSNSSFAKSAGEANAIATAAASPAAVDGSLEEKLTLFEFILRYEFYIWAVTFYATIIIVWAVVIADFKIGELGNVRSVYRSVALAPLGAWIRWAPTRLPRIKATWPEMNPQTLFANVFAVTFMCSLTVFSQSTWVSSINDGFNGSCSTVSTFFAELHALYLEKGPYVAFRYGLTTFGLAIIIIQIIRGIGTVVNE